MSDQGQWQVAGDAAVVYERALVTRLSSRAGRLGWWRMADPRPGERVLDVACGTGVVARLASQRVGRTGMIVGLDLNRGMLAVAAPSVAGQAPTGAAITWREASAMTMPFPDG